MESREEITAKSSQGPKSFIDILGHLHLLSRHAAAGDLEHVLELAVEIPIRCLRLDKTALLLPSPITGTPALIASRNLSPSLREYFQHPNDEVINWVVTNCSPKVIENLPSIGRESVHPYSLEDVRALVAIPIEIPDSKPGVLLGMASHIRPFPVWEVELLYTIANHIAAVFGRPKTRSFPTHTDLPFERLTKVAHSTLDIRQLLDQALTEILYALDADSGSVMLCRRGIFTIYACKGLNEDIQPLTTIPKERGIAGWVIANRKPLLLNGPADPNQFDLITERPEIVSSISTPLIGRKSLVGVLSVNRTTPGRTFGNQEMVMVSTISGQIAMAVENNLLYNAATTQTKYLASLFKIAKTITSSLELKKVFELILDQLCEKLAAEVCCIVLYNPQSGEVQLGGGRGLGADESQAYIDLAMPGIITAERSKKSIVTLDLSEYKEYREIKTISNLGLDAATIVRLSIKRRVVGYIVIFHRQTSAFQLPLQRLLLGLAELAAIAIENARLYQHQWDIANISLKNLLPGEIENIPGFEVSAKFNPAHQVGGDYYEVIKISEHNYGVAIADVSGKSVAAANYIAMCKHSLRALAEETQSPAKLLQKMNRLIYQQTGNESFITMLYAVLDAKRRTLVLSCAGHEPAILYRAHIGRVEQISTPGLILGVMPSVNYQERSIKLGSGDILMLYTDGLIEAISHDPTTSLRAISEVLVKYHLKPANEIADNIYKLATAPNLKVTDDIALIVIKTL
ncbi:MAG: SpoIIE family protein phosphatase [Armatimonadota bacterium]|nr:SpoIIE family protein phosphatase [Armatimonadota bacterium]